MDYINSLLGPGYQVLIQGGNPVVVEKEPLENLASLSEYDFDYSPTEEKKVPEYQRPQQKGFDDHVFQFYIGSLSVVGLFMLFRIMQKSK